MTRRSIPIVDLAAQNRSVKDELKRAFTRVLRSGRFLFGEEAERFEAELAAWLDVKHVVGVASGTDAIEIGLRATGVEPGDATTCTAFTAPATINAIEAAGATPVLVDVDPRTRSAAVRDDRTVAVHLYGLATDMTTPPLVEDCAHALGATFHGRPVGTVGRAGAVSFYPTKCLGALGDAGAIVTDDAEVADRARAIRHYGGLQSGDITMRGQNSRLSELQAAFLRAKLPRLREWNNRRRAIAHRYIEELGGCVGVPEEPDGHYAVYYLFVVEHPERDRLREALSSRNIATLVHYPRAAHEYERYATLAAPGSLPVAERLARSVLSLPCYPELSDAQQDTVITAVRELT